MHKLVARRAAVPEVTKAGRPDNPMLPCEPFEHFLKVIRLHVSLPGSNRDRQWKFPEDARDLKDALLFETQPLNLELDHLPQPLRRLQTDQFQWYFDLPGSILDGDQSSVSHVVQSSYHEQWISFGMTIDQSSYAFCRRFSCRLDRKIFGNLSLPQ